MSSILDSSMSNKSLARSIVGIDPKVLKDIYIEDINCLLYTSPSPRDATLSRMPSSA